MKVKEVMRKPVVTLAQNATLREIVQAFIHHRVDALPIVDAAERAVGLITVFDLVELFFPRYHDLLRDFSALEDKGQLSSLFDPSMGGWELTTDKLIIAADLMHTQGPWIFEDEALLAAAARLKSRHQHKLPVVDRDNRLVGMLYDYDIVLAFMRGSTLHTKPGLAPSR
jgi:CBS domain-containing protein